MTKLKDIFSRNVLIYYKTFKDNYIPVIFELNDPTYITYNNKKFSYTTDIDNAIAFKTKEEIIKLEILNTLDYKIIQLSELYTIGYNITNFNSKIVIATTWLPIDEHKTKANLIVTTDRNKAQETLEHFISENILELHKEILKLTEIKLPEIIG